MPEPTLTATRLAGGADDPRLLVVGPSLGTSVGALWGDCAAQLPGYEVVGWDLPGHGCSPAAEAPFSVADLADAVRRLASSREGTDRPTAYAGVSLGGAVGLQLGLDPGPFGRVAALASRARIGEPAGWTERAALVRRSGTSALLDGAVPRWFAPGFATAHPQTTAALLAALADADDASYAQACEALAAHDLRADLPRLRVPLLLVAGAHDVVVPPAETAEDVAAVPAGELVVLEGCGHLPPAEDPAAVASLLTHFFEREVA